VTVAIDSPCPNLKASKVSRLPALQVYSTTGLPLSGQINFVIENPIRKAFPLTSVLSLYARLHARVACNVLFTMRCSPRYCPTVCKQSGKPQPTRFGKTTALSAEHVFCNVVAWLLGKRLKINRKTVEASHFQRNAGTRIYCSQ
jgi:hypothetical protein